MSQKLLIVVAVQSALVLGVGGAALGLSVGRGGSAQASRSGKRHGSAPKTPRSEAAAPRAKAKGAPRATEAHGDDGHEPSPEVAHAEQKPGSGAGPTSSPEHPEPDEGAPKAAGGPAGASAAAPPGGTPKGGRPAPAESGHRPATKAEQAHAPGPLRDDELHPLPQLPKEPLEAFAWLDEGNNRWANGLSKPRDLVQLRRELAAGFAPWAAVVSCSDGRVVPEAVFDAPPGALVTIKAPVFTADTTLAAGVELALKKHPVPVLVLLGHAGCDDGSGRATEEQVTAVAAKLMGRTPLRERARAGKLLMLRAVYGLETGRVRWLDSEEAAHDESAHR
ncbi:MAG: hypothetical protein INH41_03825 [Myxococcaceae bacterium]|nr:hypothetical protein [Myxococcaceae bacterium]MCA3011509.1 hypothetical protein [Myxococcaceae bacterium]